jgi:aminomethyltransferase
MHQTALHAQHEAAGARMAPFAGWSMPLQYQGALAEHRAVREHAGVFDVSHMGQLLVEGPSAATDLQHILSNDIEKLTADGHAQYTLLTNDHGGIEDDLIVYRLAPDSFLLVVNASNIQHDLEWIRAGVHATTTVDDESPRFAMLAVQGPQSLELLEEHGICDLRNVPPFRVERFTRNGATIYAATTGYTGELGCELVIPNEQVAEIWDQLVNVAGMTPCGLAARDVLRLESCYPLHGNDIDATTSAVSAGLGWVCGWSSDFVGRDALNREREHGPRETLQALSMTEPGIPRAGCEVQVDGTVVGRVTSGGYSPILESGIALAYIRTDVATVGQDLQIDVRGKLRAARIAERPLYRRNRA